jgi:hypothetical protein
MSDNPTPARGLGDTIAKATTALGVKPCPGCKRRQAALNRLIPYRQTPGQRPPLSAAQLEAWNQFKRWVNSRKK